MQVGKNRINLVPKKNLQQHYKRQIQKWMILILLIEIGGFIGGFIVRPYVRLQEVEAQLEQMSIQLKDEDYTSVNQELKQLETIQTEVEKWEEKYQSLKKEQGIDRSSIDTLFMAMPRDLTICLITLSKEDDEMIIEGSAQQAKSILDYQFTLENQFSEKKVCSEFVWEQEEKQYIYSMRVEREGDEWEENDFEEGEDEELSPNEEGGVGEWIQ